MNVYTVAVYDIRTCMNEDDPPSKKGQGR